MDWAPLLRTRAEGWTILVRLMVGLVVFFPEGIQKLVFPEILGSGRFANIGIPFPEMMGPFVGTVEIVCGALIILGLFTPEEEEGRVPRGDEAANAPVIS